MHRSRLLLESLELQTILSSELGNVEFRNRNSNFAFAWTLRSCGRDLALFIRRAQRIEWAYFELDVSIGKVRKELKLWRGRCDRASFFFFFSVRWAQGNRGVCSLVVLIWCGFDKWHRNRCRSHCRQKWRDNVCSLNGRINANRLCSLCFGDLMLFLFNFDRLKYVRGKLVQCLCVGNKNDIFTIPFCGRLRCWSSVGASSAGCFASWCNCIGSSRSKIRLHSMSGHGYKTMPWAVRKCSAACDAVSRFIWHAGHFVWFFARKFARIFLALFPLLLLLLLLWVLSSDVESLSDEPYGGETILDFAFAVKIGKSKSYTYHLFAPLEFACKFIHERHQFLLRIIFLLPIQTRFHDRPCLFATRLPGTPMARELMHRRKFGEAFGASEFLCHVLAIMWIQCVCKGETPVAFFARKMFHSWTFEFGTRPLQAISNYHISKRCLRFRIWCATGDCSELLIRTVGFVYCFFDFRIANYVYETDTLLLLSRPRCRLYRSFSEWAQHIYPF